MTSPWDSPTTARYLYMAAILIDRDADKLGRAVAHGALHGDTSALDLVSSDIAEQVRCSGSSPLDFGQPHRSFLRQVERGEFDGSGDPTPFSEGSAAALFAGALRCGDSPTTSPIAVQVCEVLARIIGSLAVVHLAAVHVDGAFVPIEAASAAATIRELALHDEMQARENTHGTTLTWTGASGRDFISGVRRGGWSRTVARWSAPVGVDFPPLARLARLQEVGASSNDVEVGPAHVGGPASSVVPRSALGRIFCTVMALGSLDDALAAVKHATDALPPRAAPTPAAEVRSSGEGHVPANEVSS